MESRLVALYKSDSEYQILDRQVHKLLYLLACSVFLDLKLNVVKKMDFPASVFILQKSIKGIEICWNKSVLYVKLQIEKTVSLGFCAVVGKKGSIVQPSPLCLHKGKSLRKCWRCGPDSFFYT